VQGIAEFFHALGKEAASLWDMTTTWMVSVFDPQSGWQPKAIFGAVLLFIIFWISKRGTKST
jgi:hypothetical protein